MGWKQPLDTLTKEQRKYINSLHLDPPPKPKRVRDRRYHAPVDPHKNDPIIPNTPQNELEKKYGKPFLTDEEWEKSEERKIYCRRTFN